MMTQVRQAILLLLTFLTGFGILPEDIKTVIEANVDAVLSGVFAVWLVVSYIVNRKKEAE